MCKIVFGIIEGLLWKKERELSRAIYGLSIQMFVPSKEFVKSLDSIFEHFMSPRGDLKSIDANVEPSMQF